MTLAETLDQHFQLCQEVHQLLLEENRLLQTTRRPPEQGFLTRKEQLLPRLDAARLALHIATHSHTVDDCRAHSPAIERVQKKLLAILLLDRENEKLLLKYSVQASAFRPTATRPAEALVRRAYATARTA